MLTLREVVAVLLLTGAPLALAAQQEPLGSLDGFVQTVMRDWEAPGVAVAVVKDDQVVFARGYGVREVGGSEPVDTETLFAIASTSKAFTAAAVGMLVDEGRVGWDDRVTDHLPGFQLYDPYVTRELTVRDILSHRSGLPRGDRLWYLSPFDRDEILQRVRGLEPNWSFRSHYGYQNIMFIAAGQLVEAVTDTSWDDFLRHRIFDPLDMPTSTTRFDELQQRTNVATPHGKIDGKVTPLSWRDWDNVGGAGAVHSCAAEMAQWIRMQLGEGAYEGRRFLSDSVIREMRRPQTIVPRDTVDERLFPESHFYAYGLGWRLMDYRGRLVVRHGGALDGIRTHLALVPEEELGVVAITNMNESLVPQAIVWQVIDAYLGPRDKNWNDVFKALDERNEHRADSLRTVTEKERVEGTAPTHALADFAGTYESELYGEAVVEEDDGHLVLRIGPAFAGDLQHWHYNTFRAQWRDRYMGRDFVTFQVSRRGKVSGMEVQGFGLLRKKQNDG